MTELASPEPDADRMVYQIRIKGHLGQEWTDWFGGLSITIEDNGEMLMVGPMDQATLHGVLKKVRDLGVPLLAVSPVEAQGRRDHLVQGAKR